MFEVLFDGTHYEIAPIGAVPPGWSAIDSAGTVEEGYAKSQKDWDHFWGLCGLVPSRSISVTLRGTLRAG